MEREEYKYRRLLEILQLVGERDELIRIYSIVEKEYVQIEFLFRKLGIYNRHRKFLDFLYRLSKARVASSLNEMYKITTQVAEKKIVPKGYEVELNEEVG